MAITFRSYTSWGASATTNTAPKPTGTVENDILIACQTHDSSYDITAPDVDAGAGAWVELANAEHGSGTWLNTAIFYKKCTDNEPTEYVFNNGGSAPSIVTIMCFYTDGTFGTPVISTVNDTTATNNTTNELTVDAGTALVASFSHDDNYAVTTPDPTSDGFTHTQQKIWASAMSLSCWYDESASGTVSTTLTYTSSGEITSYLIAIPETASASRFPYESIEMQRRQMKVLLTR